MSPSPLVWLVVLLVVLPATGLVSAWAYMIQMPGQSYDGPLLPLSEDEALLRDRLEGHVRALAEGIGERNVSRPAALEAAARYIEDRFEELGHEVTTLSYEVDGVRVRNLEVTLPGRTDPAELVLVGAHYDSAPGTPGANDNASGVAALLELAALLGSEPLDRTVRLVAFTNEEPPYFETPEMGSRVYAGAAAARGDRITAMISLETIGYYSEESDSQSYPVPLNLLYPDRGDFIGFVGNLSSRSLVRRSIATFRETTPLPTEGAAVPSGIPGVGWSDHSSFWIHDFPAIMITDTALFRYPHYHLPTDTPDQLDYLRMVRVVQGVAEVVRELASGGA